ncbi:39S ribosomal protein L14, mitochondrial [Atta colombica]|uniref:39S ribosomal protein L14, mitochondrial n=1 Tax=Atta colombica TaxID=520822 RepID=A0A195BS33_9HYME|nr:39S ribosomal protein L14, mitochondrial [Atta colombica]
MLSPFAVSSVSRNISTSTPVSQIKLSRLRVMDNSEIHICNKCRMEYIGDRILIAIRDEKKKDILIELKQQQFLKVSKFDSNNLILIDDNGTPLGTRIQVSIMKEQTHSKGDYIKLIAIAFQICIVYLSCLPL